MTVPASVRLLVLLDVVRAIGTIAQGDGYTYTIPPERIYTEPVNLLAVPAEELPCAIVAPDERGTREYQPARQVRERVGLLVTLAVLADDETDPHRKITAAENIAHDVERALLADIRRGGLAMCTVVHAPEPMLTGVAGQNLVLLNVPVDVELRRTA